LARRCHWGEAAVLVGERIDADRAVDAEEEDEPVVRRSPPRARGAVGQRSVALDDGAAARA